jgi:predicted KAP-like P-loop ATPase
MDKLLEKLEAMLQKYLDEIETKPFKTILLTIVIYYLFRAMNRKK